MKIVRDHAFLINHNASFAGSAAGYLILTWCQKIRVRYTAELDPLDTSFRYLFLSIKKVWSQITKDPNQLNDRGLVSPNRMKSGYAGGARGVSEYGICSIT